LTKGEMDAPYSIKTFEYSYPDIQVSLREPIRAGVDDAGLKEIIGAAIKRKKAKHAGMFDIAKTANRPMIHIGG